MPKGLELNVVLPDVEISKERLEGLRRKLEWAISEALGEEVKIEISEDGIIEAEVEKEENEQRERQISAAEVQRINRAYSEEIGRVMVSEKCSFSEAIIKIEKKKGE